MFRRVVVCQFGVGTNEIACHSPQTNIWYKTSFISGITFKGHELGGSNKPVLFGPSNSQWPSISIHGCFVPLPRSVCPGLSTLAKSTLVKIQSPRSDFLTHRLPSTSHNKLKRYVVEVMCPGFQFRLFSYLLFHFSLTPTSLL